jgi:hypothetical protein
MYGDTLVMRKRAAQLREQGAEIRVTADRLVASSEAIAWSGRAANDMRARVKERASHLRSAADAHDHAAEWLERHLVEVDRLKDAITDAERRTSGRVADDRALAAIELPPSGHADWLSLELPGAG